MKIEYSKQVQEELSKHQFKNKQRFSQIMKGKLKIELNPTNVENLTYSLNGYWCEKAAPQIRIFYEIIQSQNVIFLTWVNPEEFPHDTNNGQDRDPCYNEFTRLFNNGALEKYQPPEKLEDDTFSMSGKWQEEEIYCLLKKEKFYSDSILKLQLVPNEKDLAYEILYFDTKSKSTTIELELLLKIIDEARGYKITFTYYLHKSLDELVFNHKKDILINAHFEFIESDDSIEVWQLFAA